MPLENERSRSTSSSSNGGPSPITPTSPTKPIVDPEIDAIINGTDEFHMDKPLRVYGGRPPPQEKKVVADHHNAKNSRKSRSGRGRGLPKKGGGGGKGTWGRPGCEIIDELDYLEDESLSEEEQQLIISKPKMKKEDFKNELLDMFKEYLESLDADDIYDLVRNNHHETDVVIVIISDAMERHNMHRELASQLLSDLHHKRLLAKVNATNGFDELLGMLEDMVLDTPDAPDVLGMFAARAVADECLPYDYIESFDMAKIDSELGKAAIQKAKVLLSMKQGIYRLDNVWGESGGIRPVKYLASKMKLLLEEYFASGDLLEAARVLQELEVIHFHHQFVYMTIEMVIENAQNDRAVQVMARLLKYLCDSNIITNDQLKMGFKRVYADLSDIVLDAPLAYDVCENFAFICYKNGFLPQSTYLQVPQRGRKRFVSECEGGRIKDVSL